MEMEKNGRGDVTVAPPPPGSANVLQTQNNNSQPYVLLWPPDISTIGGKALYIEVQEVSSDDTRCHQQVGQGKGGPMSRGGARTERALNSEIQCIMGNGHMGPPNRITDTCESLPSCNFVGGR